MVSVIVAYLRVVTGCFKGCFVGGSMRVIEDILLSEHEQGREMAHKKVQVLIKMSRNRAP